MTRTNRWREELEREMPPREDPVAYNRAITAHYARWYLAEPRFKWAAMATFPSYQTGQLLALAHGHENERHGAVRMARRGAAAVLGSAIALVRDTNAAVFADVGWAHHAFIATGGDAQAIAREHDAQNESDLVRAFAELAHARDIERREGPCPASRFAIWEGTRLILRHEQLVTVQPIFGRIVGAWRMHLTLLSATPFHELATEKVHDTRFLPHALRRWARTRIASDLPDMTKFEQRWPWIEQEVLPLYREVESRGDPRMRALMERYAMLDGGATVAQSSSSTKNHFAEVCA
jgi:hypothetical protein